MSPSALHRASFAARSTAVLSLVALSAASCKGSDPPRRQPAAEKDAGTRAPPDAAVNGEQAGQWYRAWMNGGPDVGDVPFFLQLPARPNRGTALLATGNLRVEAEARWYGTEVSVNHSLLRTRMFLRQDDDGSLSGHVTSHSPVIEEGSLSVPLRAVPVPEPDEARRFPDAASCDASARATGLEAADSDQPSDKKPAPAPGSATGQAPAEPWGSWLVSFETLGAGELVLELTRPGVVTGSFEFDDGTVSVLVGNSFGSRICLSAHNGVNAYLAVLDVAPGGDALRGRWSAGAGLQWRSALKANKRKQVTVASNSIMFEPNETKVSLSELGLPQYRGKPVIIEFGGSWCPPCLDSAPLLREIYEKHHGQGLEMVTLLFELLDDEEAMGRQAKLFIETHEIPWQVIPVHGEISPYWDIVPHDPDVASVNLPVMLFVNVDGTIRDAHTGFPGPESGQLYQDMVERYRRIAAELVAGK
jgi:thiol-disulfide isomerase/thioredoxin